MKVGQICGGRLVKVAQETPLSQVARVMSTQQVGVVIVTDGSGDQAPIAGIVARQSQRER